MSIVQERRMLKTVIRAKRREVLPKLRAAIKAAKKDLQKRLRACKADCRRLMKEAKQRAKTARRKLEIAIRRAQARAKEICQSCKVVDEKGVNEITAKLEALDKERKEIDKLRAQAATLISPRGRAGGKKSAEKRSESDDQVIRDLGEDKEMIALFKKVRAKIKRTKNRNRTEAFLEYVHDHPEELDELRARAQHKYEREAERLFRERQPEANGNSCWRDSSKCERELAELRAAEKFLKEADVPF